MQKIRDIPTEFQEKVKELQSPEFQEHLRNLVAEEGQRTLATKFMRKEDAGDPLSTLDYKLLESCQKPISPDWGTKQTVWEEGDDVCYSYGVLTLRGFIRWNLHTVSEGTWLLPSLTESGTQTLQEKVG